MGANIGWLYTRNYFKEGKSEFDLDFNWILKYNELKSLQAANDTDSSAHLKKEIERQKVKNKKALEVKNNTIKSVNLKNFINVFETTLNNITEPIYTNISLLTIYPGLLIGSGYEHETTTEGELKLGMQFDHTTGLPYIPGHSVKGVVRYYLNKPFSDKNGNLHTIFESFVNSDLESKNQKLLPIEVCNQAFDSMFPNNDKTSMYNTDIYFDAFPDKDTTTIFDFDFNTPHKSPIKSPIPLSFLKIKEDITMNFRFLIKTSIYVFENNQKIIIGIELKKKMFSYILKNFGIGAKTNVGYGQFISKEDQREIPNLKIIEDVPVKEGYQNQEVQIKIVTELDNLKQGSNVRACVIDNTGGILKLKLSDLPSVICSNLRYQDSTLFKINQIIYVTISGINGKAPNIKSITINNPKS